MFIIRVSIATVARIPHAVADGIHIVAPRLRSRYTVHAVAVTLMSVGFRMGHSEHAAIEWAGEHLGAVVKFVAEYGWEPLGELFKGIGIAPYLDGAVSHGLRKLAPDSEEKE